MTGAKSISEIDELLSGLPCGEEISAGLRDMKAGRTTVQSCLVAIASPRLKKAGLVDQTFHLGDPDSEHTLYRLLGQIHDDPYPAYQARLRELVSFENALDHRLLWLTGLTA